MAVSEMAVSTGKKRRKTGTSIVPNPKPAKKVSNDALKATMGISISICKPLNEDKCTT